MAVTSVNDIKNQASKEVDIVGFEKGEFITLRLKRLSIMGLASKGKIPNALMSTAVALFEGKTSNAKKEDEAGRKKAFNEMAELIDVVCDNSMIEPTFAEVGVDLTDEQKMEIFYYAQGGLVELEGFRKEPRNP